jgi:hypothetical protein
MTGVAKQLIPRQSLSMLAIENVHTHIREDVELERRDLGAEQRWPLAPS